MKDAHAILKARKRVATIFILFFSTLVVVGMFWFLIELIYMAPRFYNRPERSVYVEVVGKRIRVYHHAGGNVFTSYDYIVSFAFPDGSIKELKIYRIALKQPVSDKESYCPAYASLQEGDTGKLTYQEVKNIEKMYKNEDMRYGGRFFIRFQRDPEYGELKIESTEQRFETWHFILLGGVVIIWIILIRLLVKGTWKALKFIHNIKLEEKN